MATFVKQISQDHLQAVSREGRSRATPRRLATGNALGGSYVGRSRRYLVCYDTPDDMRRREFARILSAWGVRVQWSVFECALNDRELLRLTRALDRVVQTALDDLRVFQCAATGQPTHKWVAAYADHATDYWVA